MPWYRSLYPGITTSGAATTPNYVWATESVAQTAYTIAGPMTWITATNNTTASQNPIWYVQDDPQGHIRHGVVPLEDNLLAQKLMLELNEMEFLRIANRHG